MIERKVYQCEHCKAHRKKPKIYFSSRDMWLHENSCFYNLANKTCFTCEHNLRNIKVGFTSLGCDLGHIKKENMEDMPLSAVIKTNCPDWENEFVHKEIEYGEDDEW